MFNLPLGLVRLRTIYMMNSTYVNDFRYYAWHFIWHSILGFLIVFQCCRYWSNSAFSIERVNFETKLFLQKFFLYTHLVREQKINIRGRILNFKKSWLMTLLLWNTIQWKSSRSKTRKPYRFEKFKFLRDARFFFHDLWLFLFR